MRKRVKARKIPIFIAIAIILVPGIGFAQGATPGAPEQAPPNALEQGPGGFSTGSERK